MFKVSLRKQANKELEKIPNTHYEKVLSALKSLETDPYSGKQLKGAFSKLWVVRAWPYRIIYEIYKNDLIVQVISIGHRKDAYK